MNITDAVNHLTEDLKHYAASGRASAKAIAFKQTVLNAVIDGVNRLEERMVKQVEPLHARIAALENDLTQRDQLIKQLRGGEPVDLDWSYLEGRAQVALNYRSNAVGHEEGRSMSAEEVAKERKFLDLVRREFDFLYDSSMALQIAFAAQVHQYRALLGWCQMHGMDLEAWVSIPADWYTHIALTLRSREPTAPGRSVVPDELPEAVAIAMDRRVIDGVDVLVDMRQGPGDPPRYIRMRSGIAYRNVGAVAYNILSGVVLERAHRDMIRTKGLPDDPERAPLWMWESALLHDSTLLPERN